MKLLFLLAFPPDPGGAHGAARMSGQLLSHAVERHEVAAIYLRADGEAPIDARLASRLALAVEVRRPPLAGALRRAIGIVRGRPTWATDWAVSDVDRRLEEVVHDWGPDVIQAELSVMGQYLPPAVLDPAIGGWPPTVLVDHDPGAATAAELAGWERGLRRLGRRLDAAAWRRYERRVLAAADAVVVFTEEDRGRIAARAPADRVKRIAPGVDLPGEGGAHGGGALGEGGVPGGGRAVVFVGGFGHPPNVEAALRLGRAIFPAVRARVPAATLEIVGADPPAEVRALAGDGVTVTGRVPDAQPYLERAAVVAAPLRLGGGMRVKVLEALAAGKPLVATPRALAGIDLAPGEHALIGESDAELADAIAVLLEDADGRGRMGKGARDWVAEHLSWKRTLDAYDDLYRQLVAGAKHR
jgi:glycosyltransferase involved in cell wall biosynthesis